MTRRTCPRYRHEPERATTVSTAAIVRKPVVGVVVLALLVAGCAVAAAHDAPEADHPTQFTDVHSGEFYATAVDWMVTAGITNGTSPTTFSPNDKVTRGQAAAFIWRTACEPAPSSTHRFVDVVADWQQDPVSWLLENNAAPVLGTTDPSDRFGPDAALTRGQMAVLLYRIQGAPTDAVEIALSFADVTEPWQIEPVKWLLHEQITSGTSPTTFSPDRTVTRAEFATFIWRYSQQPAPGTPRCEDPPPEPTTWFLIPERVVEVTGCGASSVLPGEQIRLTTNGFAPGTKVTFTVKGAKVDGDTITPLSVPAPDSTTADSDGSISVLWTVPAAPDVTSDAAPRGYALEATGLNPNGGTHTAVMIQPLVAYPSIPPCATADTATTALSQPVEIAVLANDIAPTGGILDVLTLRIRGGSDKGFTVNETTGVVTYTPEPGLYGTATGSYVVYDNWGLGVTADLTVTIASGCTITGTADVTAIIGTEGDDVLCVPDPDDRRAFHILDGVGGDDVIIGGAGSDWIYGGDGDDVIYGRGEDDHIVAGAGIDTIYGGTGEDSVYSLDFEDTIIDDSYELIITPRGGTGPVSPTAADDWVWVEPSGTVQIDVLANDHDPNGNLDRRSLRVLRQLGTGAARVTTASNGLTVVEYTADQVSGTNTVAYEICDTFNQCDTAEVTVLVGAAGCTTVGTDADETLYGTPGDDIICGLGGDDVIYGLGGNDIIIGGKGDDTLHGGDTADTADTADTNAFDGDDMLWGGDGDDILKGGAGGDTLNGGNGNDTIDGGTGADQIFGGVGDDMLNGGGGDDAVFAGYGADMLHGGSGDDIVWGYAGNNMLWGDDGADTLHGGFQDDTLNGGDGADLLWGNSGNDILNGGGHDDQLHGGFDDDVLNGGDGNDLLFGSQGADRLDGGNGTNHLDGGPDTDTCTRSNTTTSCETEN